MAFKVRGNLRRALLAAGGFRRPGAVLPKIGAIVLFIASCSLSQSLPVAKLELVTASGAIVPLQAELARSETEQEKGYMGRKTIPDGTGMLFVYESDRKMYFWMKNTPHPLSIAYIDSSGVIRDIFDMQPLSLATVESSGSVRYALEVPQGWFGRVGVKAGDKIGADSLAAALKAE